MLVLSRASGRQVRAADGRVVGRLHDLTARLDAEHPVVYRLAVGTRRHLTHLVPWSAVAAFEPPGVRLHDIGPTALAAPPTRSHGHIPRSVRASCWPSSRPTPRR